MERPARAAFVGATIAALITLPGLGAGTLWDNSETAYGEVAREVLLTHDWVVMHFNGLPYFIQPPLYFWVGALVALLLGPTALALRLPAALATILMGGMTGYAVARQAGTRVGIYAAAILSSCLMQAVIGRLAIMDALLDLTVAMTIFWWFRAMESGRDRYIYFGAIAVGLGMLTKGPVALVVPLLVLGPYYLWNRRAERTYAGSLRSWALGALIVAAIVLPWMLAVIAREGFGAIVLLVGRYTIGRYTGVIENQAGPLWYYLPVIVLGFFPWIGFLPMAIVHGVRTLLGRDPSDAQSNRLLRLAFCWIVVPLLFFSFARTKLPNYVALEFPALALLTALYFEAVVRRGGARAAVASAAIVPLTIGALAVAIAIFTRNNRLTADVAAIVPSLFWAAVAIFAGSALTAVLIARRATVGLAPYALAAAAMIGVDALAVLILPHAEAYKPVPRLAAIVQRERKPGDVVAIQNVSGANALLFYTQPPIETLGSPSRRNDAIGRARNPRRAICSVRRIWVIAPATRPAYDPTYGRRRTLVATDAKTALFLYHGPGCTPGGAGRVSRK